MDRISISELTTLRWPFEEDVAWIRRMGFGAIGIWREKLADFGEEKGAELLRDNGIQVSSLQWAGGFTGSDGRTFNESVQDAIEAIHLAAELQAGCLIVHSGSQAGHTRRHAMRLLRWALDEMLPVAAEYDVNIALEPMPAPFGRDWTLLGSLDECGGVLDQIGSPRLGLVFDLYHMANQPDLFQQIERHIDSICLVQMADQRREAVDEPNRCLLGEGRLQVAEVFEAFRRFGYRGFFEIELLGEELELLSYPDILTHTREALTSCYSGINSRQIR